MFLTNKNILNFQQVKILYLSPFKNKLRNNRVYICLLKFQEKLVRRFNFNSEIIDVSIKLVVGKNHLLRNTLYIHMYTYMRIFHMSQDSERLVCPLRPSFEPSIPTPIPTGPFARATRGSVQEPTGGTWEMTTNERGKVRGRERYRTSVPVVFPSARELTLFHRLSAAPNSFRLLFSSFRREKRKIEFQTYGQA